MTIAEQKTELRSALRARCEALPQHERAALSRAACERLAKLFAFSGASCILAYKAMPRECDPQALVELALKLGKRVAFPVCAGDYKLKLLCPLAGDAFVRGKYGILEPDAARSKELEPEELELIVVPGVAFDACRNRLGQGAGYYDRLLKDTRAIKAGFAFPQQLVPAVPVDALDVPMDIVTTADTVFSL